MQPVEVHLIWNVTFPNLMPLSVTYNSSSLLNIAVNLPLATRSYLTQYRNTEYIEALLVFTVMKDATLTGTRVECEFQDDKKTEILLINNNSKSKILQVISYSYVTR